MKKTIITAILTSALAYASAQDIHFSQYIFTTLPLNPALTAAHKDVLATVQHKEQWQSVNAFRTSAATFEMKFGQPNWTKIEKSTGFFKRKVMKGLAAGLNAFSDAAGDANMKHFQLNLSLAYHVMLNKNHSLSGGLLTGYAQRSISGDGLRWGSQYNSGNYDPNQASNETFTINNFSYVDIGAGLLWSFGNGSRYMTSNDQKHFHAGFSIAHINRPSYSWKGSSERLERKYTLHGNSLFGIKNTLLSAGPSVLYMKQGTQQEITAGFLLKYQLKENSKYTGNIKGSAISAGCYYRNRDAVIPFLMFELDAYSIGVSYDTNISDLTTATSGRGGIEITLRFNSPNPFLYQNTSRI